MNSIINFLNLGLDGADRRQRALVNNISNVNTPGYKRKDVDFISTLNSVVDNKRNKQEFSLKITDKRHLKGNSVTMKPFKKIRLSNTNYRNDANNVDIDVEMAELVKNQLYYNTMTQQINERFKDLRDTISKGGR